MDQEVTKKTFHHALWEDGHSRFHFGGDCSLDRRSIVEAFDNWYNQNWWALNSALRCEDPHEAVRRIARDEKDPAVKDFLYRNGDVILAMLK